MAKQLDSMPIIPDLTDTEEELENEKREREKEQKLKKQVKNNLKTSSLPRQKRRRNRFISTSSSSSSSSSSTSSLSSSLSSCCSSLPKVPCTSKKRVYKTRTNTRAKKVAVIDDSDNDSGNYIECSTVEQREEWASSTQLAHDQTSSIQTGLGEQTLGMKTYKSNSIIAITCGDALFDVPHGFAGLQAFLVSHQDRPTFDQCFKYSEEMNQIDQKWPITSVEKKSGYLILRNLVSKEDVDLIEKTDHVLLLNDGCMDFLMEETAAIALFTHVASIASNKKDFFQIQIAKCNEACAVQKRQHFLNEKLKEFKRVNDDKLTNCWSFIAIPPDNDNNTNTKNSDYWVLKECIFRNAQGQFQLCLLSWCEQCNNSVAVRMALLYENVGENKLICQVNLSPSALYKLSQDFVIKNKQMLTFDAPVFGQKDMTNMYKEYKKTTNELDVFDFNEDELLEISSQWLSQTTPPNLGYARVPLSPTQKDKIPEVANEEQCSTSEIFDAFFRQPIASGSCNTNQTKPKRQYKKKDNTFVPASVAYQKKRETNKIAKKPVNKKIDLSILMN